MRLKSIYTPTPPPPPPPPSTVHLLPPPHPPNDILCISWQDIISTYSKIVLDKKFLNIRLTEAFLYGANFSPKMSHGGAKIKWRGAAVALMRWLENFSRALVLYSVLLSAGFVSQSFASCLFRFAGFRF